ncbi:uncharacterized protein PAC_12512 [Phialocephala subalpina]|uniref:Uncharacterized protein n=1 Tax=Phialocephala subalpina TaxID=576137 RepID=A0A1L7XC80_9HELO|nr:uncharacterized protein PAC_12512 [Phialocephala subalpina]
MSSLRSYLNSRFASEVTFHPRSCKALEVWSTDQGPISREHDLLPDEIIAWIDQTGPYQPQGSNSEQCNLRLLSIHGVVHLKQMMKGGTNVDSYQEWLREDQMKDQDKMPFARDVFDHLLEAFSLSPDYLYLFSQNKYTPLLITPSNAENECTSIVFQSPSFDSFGTLTLSYNAKTGAILGFLGYNAHDVNTNIIKRLRNALADVAHPLLLPTILFRTWITAFVWENGHATNWVRNVKDITCVVYKPGANPKYLRRIDEAHEDIVNIHNIIHNAMATFVTSSATNLQDALQRIPGFVNDAQMIGLRRSHADMQALMLAWSNTVNCELYVRNHLGERLSMQLQVLYQMMQREDTKSSKMMAESSRRIAEDTRNDSKAMKAIGEQSKRIAEFTQLDSSAMKTIAAVTMIFLPGTAIAVRLLSGPVIRLLEPNRS